MTHDPQVYKDPEVFDPDRYTPVEEGGRGEPFPTGHFGFGRRICVGRQLADNSVWIMAATMLAALDMRKKVDEDGKVIEPRVAFTNGGTW
jgi:cytochrome P450